MEKLYVMGPPPEWCGSQIEKGFVICVAARPLYGNNVENTWQLPMIHGRHYAALDPAGPQYATWCKLNQELDGRQVIYVEETAALEAALAYYQSKPQLLARLEKDGPPLTVEGMKQSKYRDSFLLTGLQQMNKGKE